MRGANFIVMCAACISVAAAIAVYRDDYRGEIPLPDHPLVIGHRGNGPYAVDNSLEGVMQAIESGADAVDMDVQMTADGVVVLLHDLFITDGENVYRAAALPYERLQSLVVRHTGATHLPTLTELVMKASTTKILIEIKVPEVMPTGIEENIIATLVAHDALGRVVVSSFNPMILHRLTRAHPEVLTMFITPPFEDTGAKLSREHGMLPQFMRYPLVQRVLRVVLGPDIISAHKTTPPSEIEHLASKGYPVFVWTLVTKEEAAPFSSLPVSGYITDEVMMMWTVRDEKKVD